jgi:hypothetical protein
VIGDSPPPKPDTSPLRRSLDRILQRRPDLRLRVFVNAGIVAIDDPRRLLELRLHARRDVAAHVDAEPRHRMASLVHGQ